MCFEACASQRYAICQGYRHCIQKHAGIAKGRTEMCAETSFKQTKYGPVFVLGSDCCKLTPMHVLSRPFLLRACAFRAFRHFFLDVWEAGGWRGGWGVGGGGWEIVHGPLCTRSHQSWLMLFDDAGLSLCLVLLLRIPSHHVGLHSCPNLRTSHPGSRFTLGKLISCGSCVRSADGRNVICGA